MSRASTFYSSGNKEDVDSRDKYTAMTKTESDDEKEAEPAVCLWAIH
jgi:hypothetical protein